MYANVADLSSAQGTFNAAQYRASGRKAVIIKATEGTGYHFGTGDAWEAQAHDAGLTVGRYHWAGSSMRGTLGDPGAEAAYCHGWLGDWSPGRFIAVDFENPLRGAPLYGLSAASAAQWCDAFLRHMSGWGWPGMAYSMVGSGVIQRVPLPWSKWYAAYPGPVPSDCALHQFTDRGPVPGVGACDDSAPRIDLVAWAHGGDTPVPVPAPPKPKLMPIPCFA